MTNLCYNFFVRDTQKASLEKYTFPNWPFPFGQTPAPAHAKSLSGSNFNPFLIGSHACGTAQLRRVQRTRQPKRSRGSGLFLQAGCVPRSKNRAPQPRVPNEVRRRGPARRQRASGELAREARLRGARTTQKPPPGGGGWVYWGCGSRFTCGWAP